MARTPNLLIAGVQKGGTTWLHRHLADHPACFMSDPKELNHFNRRDRVRVPEEVDAYLAHFAAAGDDARYVGESTPHYFWVKSADSPYSPNPSGHHTPREITHLLGPEVTVIVILRDPVARAESGFNHHISRGRIDPTTSIFDAPPALGLVDLGFYGRHGRVWRDEFGDRLHFFRFDDLRADPRRFLLDVLGRLDLDPTGLDDAADRLDEKVNSLEQLRSRSETRADDPPVRLSDADRARLADLYRDDLAVAAELSGLDLSAWLDGAIAEAPRQ